MKVLVSVLFVLIGSCWGLDNGLARTPPMGWLTWERFRCLTNCTTHPEDCISEKLIKETADSMVSEGYLAAGYEYLIIDDCWLAKERDSKGNLKEDPERFPSGMKHLSDYVHSKGLKFGIYEDYGTLTCAGYPGLIGHLKQDAELFASWGVDYIKVDGCFAEPFEMDQGYIDFGQYLQETNRSMVYSCSWPYYQEITGISPNLSLIAEHCNLWRNYDDIEDSWNSVSDIMNYFATRQELIGQFSGPGHWNDPDMLIIGNYGLSYEQAKAQMAIWSILAAPLIMSNDLRNTAPEFRDILLNKKAIAINQDELGISGKRKQKTSNIEFWTKPLKSSKEKPAWAVAVLSKRIDGHRFYILTTLRRIGMDHTKSYKFTEVFDAMPSFNVPANGSFAVKVPPTGVLFFRAEAI